MLKLQIIIIITFLSPFISKPTHITDQSAKWTPHFNRCKF